MDRVIEVKINGNHLSKDNNLAGVQGEANATYLRIEFDEGWDGYAKTVVWLDARGEKSVGRMLTADMLEAITESARIYLAPIPGEAMTEWGEILFAIDGYINGKRQRSVYGKLNVKPGDAFATLEDVTPSQAEQLQAQIDGLMENIQEQAIIAHDAATAAGGHAQAAATSAGEAAAAAQTAETNAKAAQKAASEIAGGNFASKAEAQGYANTAESNANKYTDRKIAEIPTPDVSGQIGSHNSSAEAHADIRKAASDAAAAAAKAVKKSGDTMTGRLTLPSLNIDDELIFGFIGSDGSTAKLQIIVFDKASGQDCMLEIMTNGLRYTGSDYIERTVIHTGNLAQFLGVAQASLEE